MESISAAISLFRSGSMREAEQECRRLLEKDPRHFDALALMADIQLSGGNTDAAIVALQSLATARPNDAANLRRLGGALLTAGRAAEAIESLQRSIALDPDNVRGRNNLGQALMQNGEISQAISQLQRALELNPRYAIGHNNLGLALMQSGRIHEAMTSLQKAVELDPLLLDARVNLGTALERAGEMQLSLQTFNRILETTPSQFDALVARATLLLKMNRAGPALADLDAALALRPSDAIALARKACALLILERTTDALLAARESLHVAPSLGEALHTEAAILSKLNRPEEALRRLERVIELDPGDVRAWCDRAIAHQQLEEQDEAMDCYRRALALDPESALARSGLISALIPAVPGSLEQTLRARAEFGRELASFEAWMGKRILAEADAWFAARQPFFYLSYQELANRELLRRYRCTSADHLQACLAEVKPREKARRHRVSQGRFRLGILSAHLFDHSVFNAIVRGWLDRLDRGKFEIMMFSVGARRDAATQYARDSADWFEGDPRSAREWADRIRELDLDALIFPEVGIDRTTLSLANLRLAGRQFACWGHPETTGLPAIDGFLSAECFEPQNAEEHYSEPLIRLPNLGVHYHPLGEPRAAIDFAHLRVSSGPPFVCPGAPFKYRPEDDVLLAQIAHQVGPCNFVFFEYERAALSRKVRERIGGAFKASGLEPREYLAWIPWQPRTAFLSLLGQADVFLDTIGFSGFNTMMHAIEAHLPAVSYEGQFMRGRLGSGILRRLGLDELVARSKPEYVELAVRLARDNIWRSGLRLRLGESKARAYGDDAAIEALSQHLLSG